MILSSVAGPLRFEALGRVWPLPRNGSLHRMALDRHLLLNLWILLALAGAAHVIALLGLLLTRDIRAADVSAPRTLRLEYLPLAAFALLFGWLAMKAELLWAETRYTGAEPSAFQVEVTGMQFAWYFRYAGQDATFGRVDPALADPAAGNPVGIDPSDEHGKDDLVSSELVLPAGREVDLRLRALDVIHGFAIPEMRLKQNAVPGQTIHVHFTPSKPGIYAVLCTQLCGLGHYRMNANLRVLPASEFERWIHTRETRAAP